MSDFERFFSKVEITDSCWTWIGSTNTKGYGRFWDGFQLVMPHRWIYEQLIGRIPIGKEIDHQCCNRACVNVNHFKVVSHKDNVLAEHSNSLGAVNKRKTHCPKDHPYTLDNTLSWPSNNGRRRCKECRKQQVRIG